MNEPLTSIDTQKLDGLTIVRLTGEIDLSNIDQLEHQLGWTIEGSSRVAIDLSGVEYLDSTGLRLIKQLSDKVQNRGGEFAVVVPKDSFVRQVLEMSRMDAYVTIWDSVEG